MDCEQPTESQTFFVLDTCMPGSPGGRRAATDFYKDYKEGDPVGPAPTCPGCGGFIGSLQWLPPYRGELECWGVEYADVIYGSGDCFLVTERFRAVYEKSGLRGLSGFDPVVIRRVIRRGKVKGEIPKYYRVEVCRSRAAVDWHQSGAVWDVFPTCDECRVNGRGLRRSERIVLEAGSWSGEDVFMPRGATYLVTARFRDVCLSHDINHVTFVPIEQYWQDIFPRVDLARPILAQPVGGPILERVVASGHVLRWDRRSNIFIFIDPEHGGVKGVFNPRDPEAFWRRYG